MGKCSKGRNCIRSHGDNSEEEKKDDKGKNKEKESGSKK